MKAKHQVVRTSFGPNLAHWVQSLCPVTGNTVLKGLWLPLWCDTEVQVILKSWYMRMDCNHKSNLKSFGGCKPVQLPRCSSKEMVVRNCVSYFGSRRFPESVIYQKPFGTSEGCACFEEHMLTKTCSNYLVYKCTTFYHVCCINSFSTRSSTLEMQCLYVNCKEKFRTHAVRA